MDKFVCVGVITGAHGIKGNVRIKSHTETPHHLTAYGPLTDVSGMRKFHITQYGENKHMLICAIDGIKNRNDAEALTGTALYIHRAALPTIEEENHFYHADLIGLQVQDMAGTKIGEVRAIYDFGSGDILEIVPFNGEADETLEFRTEMIPFTKKTVPVIAVDEGYLTVDFPLNIACSPVSKMPSQAMAPLSESESIS